MESVVAVHVPRPYVLRVVFSDGRRAEVDVGPLLHGEMFEPLRDPALFAQASVDKVFGAVVWPNGADLSPEFLYRTEPAKPSGDPLLSHLRSFIQRVSTGEIEVYNEISVQLELAIYLRSAARDWRVELERSVSHFGLQKAMYVKREIDVVVSSPALDNIRAVEIKYPRQGQYPEQMFKACQDVQLLEQLVMSGFGRSYFLMLADDPLFYSGESTGRVYEIFRREHVIQGPIDKPTGASDKVVVLRGKYPFSWETVAGPVKYFLIGVDPSDVGD